MKILYIITKSELGGAQTHVADLCRHFSVSENQIAVLTDRTGWLTEEMDKLGVKVYLNEFFGNSFNPVRVLRALFRTKKVVDEFSPDLIHCHSSAAGFFGRLVVRGKIRTLYTAHGWGFNVGVSSIQKWVAIVVERWMARYTEKIICVADFVRDLGLKYKIAPAEKMVVIRNGVKVPDVGGRRNDEMVKIVFVGRLAPPKRPIDLLEALRGLPENVLHRVSVKLVGVGPQFGELKKYIEDNDLKEVVLPGPLFPDQVDQVLANADIFVLPTDWEGLPYTILEAMSHGLPVISSGVGGIGEAVTIENGILVAPREVVGLRRAIEKLVADPGLRRQLGLAGREKVLRDFSLDLMFDKIGNLYDNKATI